jgi:catechol 2,3-dioxygenase-like lactoylglutathione lyase family enzyme
MEQRGRILGIGGIFFKSADEKRLRSWYQTNLGIESGPGGAMFHWRTADDSAAKHLTVWSVFPSKSDYFNQPFMINYIVDDLDALLARLKADGVSMDPKSQDSEYGRFAWIYDADGHKVELWEPPASKASSEPKKD